MVHYRRERRPGGTFFFTTTLHERRRSLLTDHIAELRAAWRETARTRPFKTIAVCILPDHLHTLWELPEGDADYPGRWRALKADFTRRLRILGVSGPANAKGEYRVWQRRYWEHAIRDDEDLRAHVDYIHFNPVKHGHVERVGDWPHSSFHRYVRQGWLSSDWGGVVGSGRGFGE